MYKQKTSREIFLTVVTVVSSILILSGCTNRALRKSSVSESLLFKKLHILLPGAEIEKIKPDSLFKEAYEIKLIQPLDHQNPRSKKFAQRIYLSHIDFSKPVVFVTEGYTMPRNRISELCRILKANQIRVEHRFFGESKPDSMEWKYLNVKQAASDYHRIVQLFKKIYKGKWISTGISKGGQTALFFRRFYPNDVDVTVVYVAPMNFAQEDPRIDRFIRNNGDEKCREKIKNYQIMLLKNRDKIIPLFADYAKKKKCHFSIGFDVTFEYGVLEYPFTFWQWGNSSCDSIPQAGASPEELFRHFVKVIPFKSYYSDKSIKSFEPAFYQFFTELGYYGYNYNPPEVKNFLKVLVHPTNASFAPKGVLLKFKPEVMKDINNWLQNYGNNIIYIYGGLDPWSATGVVLTGKTNALKIVKKNGNHRTRIRNLSKKDREKVFSTLEKWGLKIQKVNER